MIAFTVIYPGLKSIRAIETKETGDDKVWLTYWMVFGLLTVAETFFGFIFFFVPYYAWIRVGLFVWLIEFNGAQILFNGVLRDLLRKNKDLINDFIKKTQDAASDVAKKAAEEASNPANILKATQVAAQAQAAMTSTPTGGH